MTAHNDVFGARTPLKSARGTVIYYQLEALSKRGVQELDLLPFTVKILLENALRYAGGELVSEDDVLSLARWVPGQASQSEEEYPFMPARVLLRCCTQEWRSTEGQSTRTCRSGNRPLRSGRYVWINPRVYT